MNQELAVYSIKSGMSEVTIEKIEEQKQIEKIYANVLSSKATPYNAYIGITYNGGYDDSPYKNPTFIVDEFGPFLAGELTAQNTTIQYSVGTDLNIRIVDAEQINSTIYLSQELRSDINVEFAANGGTFGNTKFHFKNDSKYTLKFSDGTRLQPGQEVDCTVGYFENGTSGTRYDISLDNVASTIEKLNVEDGDKIYVTGITPNYVNKMYAIQNFAFRIDWEENVNKTFKITIAENAMHEVPIRMSDGSIYKLVPGNSYNVSITWNDGISNISISEISK